MKWPIFATIAIIILFPDASAFPGEQSSDEEGARTWDAYVKDPYSSARFESHMVVIKQRPWRGFRAWYISGVYRAKRKEQPPFWVVQLYDGDDRGFNFGCLVVLNSDGKHLRTIQRERIHWSLVAPLAKFEAAQQETKARRVVDLPDINADSFAEIATQRWKPVNPDTRASESTSIYLTDDDSIPCVFCIEFYNRWPAEGLDHGHCYLQHGAAPGALLSLDSPVFVRTENGFRRDFQAPHLNLAHFSWDPQLRTWIGPEAGPNGIWKLLKRR